MAYVMPEMWVWFVLSMSSIVARFVSRRLLVRAWRLQADDWVMLLVAIFYSATLAFIQADFVYSVFLLEDPPPEDFDYKYRVNSVLIILYEHFGLATIWLCKASMLIMFYRMTFNLGQNVAIQIAAVITAASYIFIVGAFLFWCQPLIDYIIPATEATNPQCTTIRNHMISVAVCNITTDLLILFITIPMFLRSRMPLRKKVPIVILFSLGLATVGVTAATRVLPFVDENFNQYRWAVREMSLSVIVTNLPLTVPLWNRTKTLTSGFSSFAPSSWRRTENASRGTTDEPNLNTNNTFGGSDFSRKGSKDAYDDLQLDTAWLNNLPDDQHSDMSKKPSDVEYSPFSRV